MFPKKDQQKNQPFVSQEESDAYGFKQQKVEGKNTKEDILKQNARIEKWRRMMPKIPKLLHDNDEKLKRRLRKGIPDGVRMLVWPLLADVESLKQQAKASYEDLVNSKEISQYEGQIAMDVVRTFQNNHFFNIDAITSQSLSAVLRAISLTFQDMGYCQGLNYLAASFLLIMSDENVYWHIYSLLTKYGCLDMYVNPAFTLKYYFALQGLIKQFLPDVNEKLKKFEIVPFYYAAEWFITLFSSILPMKIFLRVIDIYWFEQLKTIFRTSLAIIKIRKDEIMECKNMEQAMAVLKDFKYFYNYDPDKFIKIATKDFIFSRKDIDKYFELYQQQPK